MSSEMLGPNVLRLDNAGGNPIKEI